MRYIPKVAMIAAALTLHAPTIGLAKQPSKAEAKSYVAAVTGEIPAKVCQNLVGGYAKDVAFFRSPAAKGRKYLLDTGFGKSNLKQVQSKQRSGITRDLKRLSEARQKRRCNREIAKWKRKVRHQ